MYKQREEGKGEREGVEGERDYLYTSAAAPRQLRTSVSMLAMATTTDTSSTELSNSS